MLFYTEYRQGGATFGHCVIADNEEAAVRLIAKRNIGEVIVGFPLIDAPPLFIANGRDHLYQELSFTAWVHLKSGAGLDEVMGPAGWFTQYMCFRAAPGEPVIPALNELLVKTNKVREELGLPRFLRLTT